jgi:aminoglycoside 3-N-acetyltransferase I
MTIQFRRLLSSDRDLASRTFAVMADVFEEPHEALSGDYVDALLAKSGFWSVCALVDDRIVGGVTAHTIPMTRAQASELFIYDVAVHANARRQGVGRGLLAELRAWAAEEAVHFAFVPVDNEDDEALDFYRALDGSASPVTIFNFLR